MASKVITFYSYKGGVGRSMAMANIAVLLAKWDFKTLIIDWDLEAPGLENFYGDYIDASLLKQKAGLIELLNLKQLNPEISVSEIEWEQYISTININRTTNLDILTAGKRDENFISNVKKFDYNSFYNELEGGEYLEALRDAWLDKYDFVLIDSRTGLTDSSGVCSIHMPDILVLMFTPNLQSFYGIKNVSEKATSGQKQIIFDRFKLRTLPVPSRIENQETMLLDEWMNRIYTESGEMLEWLPKKGDGMNQFEVTPASLLSLIKIPYKTFYAYGEKLAVVDRGTTDPQEIGYSYETLAALLVLDFQNIDQLINSRDSYVKKAKGEDYSDDSTFRKKIEREQEEVKKLENVLSIKEKQEKRKNKIFGTVVVALVICIIAVFVILQFFNKSSTSTDTSVYGDSLEQKEAYLNFKSAFFSGAGSNQFNIQSNLALLKSYYLLNSKYQDSAKEILSEIEQAVSDTFTNVLSSYYKELKNPKGNVSSYFDNVFVFGTLTNKTPESIQKTIDSVRRQAQISNNILDPLQVKISSDSSGIYLKYPETGNYFIDKKQEVKNMENWATVLFSYNFKIKSYNYNPIKGTPVLDSAQKPVIEIFFCTKAKSSPIAAKLKKALNAANKYKVFTSIDFRPDSLGSTNEIMYFGTDEFLIAKSLQDIINKATGLKLDITRARTPTKNYLSIFVCLGGSEKR